MLYFLEQKLKSQKEQDLDNDERDLIFKSENYIRTDVNTSHMNKN